MANPQKENGYFKIANEIIDALIKWHLSSYEWRVLLCLMRKTYGWNKKTDWISLSQFSEATGIAESHVSRTLNMLLKQNIVTKGGNYRHPLFGLQKDWEKWIELPKGVRSHHPKVTKGGNVNLPKGVKPTYQRGGIQKTVLQKTLITKDKTLQPTVARFGDETNLIMEMFNKHLNPTLGYANTTQRKAVLDLINQFGYDKISKAVEYAISVQGQKYAPTITTPYQLKTKLAELRIYFEKQKGKKMQIINLDNL